MFEGKKVEFCIMEKDSKGNDRYIVHRGHIKFGNKSGTGFVICGDDVKGLYNRRMSDIKIIESECGRKVTPGEALAFIQGEDCERLMVVIA